MSDWRAIAKARGLDIPPRDLDRIAETLEQLEATFRPLAVKLAPDVEPATGFRAEADPT